MSNPNKAEAPAPEAQNVFYHEGICIHRNELVVPTNEGPRTVHACKVLTVSPAYQGTIDGLVDLLNLGWEIMARMEAARGEERAEAMKKNFPLADVKAAGSA